MSEDKIVINNNTGSSGIGFSGILTIIFIVLKLFEVIDWSWVWVLSPLWIPIVLVLGIISVVGIVVLLIFSIGSIFTFIKNFFQ